MASKAEATRWLHAHVGQDIDTVQIRTWGDKGLTATWAPGPRPLTAFGKTGFVLGQSHVVISRTHVITGVSPTALVMEWHDEDGTLIHTTTYRVVT